MTELEQSEFESKKKKQRSNGNIFSESILLIMQKRIWEQKSEKIARKKLKTSTLSFQRCLA